MPTTNSLQRVFPTPSGTVAITCPYCERFKVTDVPFLISSPRPMEINCDCGEMFQVILDTRVFPRKATYLSGQYATPQTAVSESMTVEDLSFVGVKLRTKFSHHIQAGDILNITFVLDNQAQSKIVKTVVARHIKERVIGTKFCEQQAFDSALAHYLNSN